MTEVTSEIPSRETILLSLKDDPIFIGEDTDDKKATLPSVDDIMAQDSRLSEELHNLNNLKLLSSLIHEFNTNLKLLEVENCYYSLENLRKKFKEKRGSFTRQKLTFSEVSDGLYGFSTFEVFQSHIRYHDCWILAPA